MFIDSNGKVIERLLLAFDVYEINSHFIPIAIEKIRTETSLPISNKKMVMGMISSCLVEVISDISLDLSYGFKLLSEKTYTYNMYKYCLADDYSIHTGKGLIIEDSFFSFMDEYLRQIAFKITVDIKNSYNLPINTKFNFCKLDYYSIYIYAYIDDTDLL